VIGTDIYIPGGGAGVTGSALQVFHTSSNTWETITTDPLPEALYAPSCASYNNRLYVIGGYGTAYLNTTRVYNPSAVAGSRWTTLATAPLAAGFGGAIAIGDQIFWAGMRNATADLANVYAYSVASNTWTTYPSLPAAHGGAGVWAIGDMLVVGGGGWSTYSTAVYEYNTSLGTGGTWATTNSLNQGRRAFAAASSPTTGRLYAGGGWNGAYLASAEYTAFPPILPDVPWLSEAPVSGTLTSPGTQVVYVTFDAGVPAVTQPGSYYATLQVQTSDPVNSNLPVPVTMTIGSPATWGKLDGTVTGLAQCDAPGAPLNKAKVFIESGTGMTSTLETNASGYYQLWLDQSNSPLTLTVSYAGYLTQTLMGVTVTGQQTTTQDVDLRLLAPCASVTPSDLSSSQMSNQQMTRTLTINNTGAASFTWDIQEKAPSSLSVMPGSEVASDARTAPASTGRSAPVYFARPDAIVFNEGFEGGTMPPTGWTRVVSNTGYTWKIMTVGTPHSGTYAADVEYDPLLARQDEWLLSPETTLVTGTLSFWSLGSLYWCRDTYNNCDLDVWLVVGSLGGGDDIYVGRADTVWPDNFVWAQSVFTLTSLLPVSPVRIGFRYTGLDGAQVGLDDILLDGGTGTLPTACQPNSIPWVTSVPTNGVTAGDSTSPVVVTFDSTGYASGVYTGSLCVNTSDPAKPTIMVPLTMTIQNPPVCSFTSSSPDDLGQVTVFTNTSTGDAPTYRWNFGDGSPVSAATHPTHTYAHVGSYTVVLTATNSLGEDVCSNPVSIEGVEASFIPDSQMVVLGTPVVFTNTTQANPAVLNWLWSFGDSTFSALQTPPPHTYASVGVYTVTLTAMNTTGSSTYTGTVTVVSSCEPVTSTDFVFTPAAPRVGETVTFTGTSTGGTSPITYTWTFGDGGVGSGSVVTHPFPLTATVKTYTVTLSAANACTSPAATASKSVTVQPRYVYLPITLR
jgi:PKD repeat protein